MSHDCLIKHVNIEQQLSRMNTHATQKADEQQQCALVLITHAGIGSALLNQAQRIFVAGTEQQLQGQLTDLYLLEVNDDLSAEQLDDQFQRCTTVLAGQSNVLLLTDLEGATPAGLAIRQGQQHGWPVLAGLNLPMLLKAITYRRTDMSELIETIVRGTQDSIRMLEPPATTNQAPK